MYCISIAVKSRFCILSTNLFSNANWQCHYHNNEIIHLFQHLWYYWGSPLETTTYFLPTKPKSIYFYYIWFTCSRNEIPCKICTCFTKKKTSFWSFFGDLCLMHLNLCLFLNYAQFSDGILHTQKVWGFPEKCSRVEDIDKRKADTIDESAQ